MEITKKSRTQIRLQNYLFLVLFLLVVGLLAWLSHRYQFELDWTASGRNTLSEASLRVLERMDGPVSITVFTSQDNNVPIFEAFIKRYRQHKPDLKLNFVNPDTHPQKTRDMGIRVDGELVIDYHNRSEHVPRLNEEDITNALQRLMRNEERRIVFLTGHGERAPEGKANHDYGEFIQHLKSKGFAFSTLNLAQNKSIPDNTATLVIASPQVNYLPGEIELINQYLDKGGNLLWLHDPGALHGLEKLADKLKIGFVEGIIVDPTTRLLDIPDPTFALVTAYPAHAITSDFNFMTLYPQAQGLHFRSDAGWETTQFLTTSKGSWSENGPLKGAVRFDEKTDFPGPLALGLALSKKISEADKPAAQDEITEGEPKPTPQQRIAVIGDGDFLSNTFVGNVGNLDLGNNLFNWLSHDDNFIAIPSKAAPDMQLTLSENGWIFIGLFFFIVLPLILLGSGLGIWWKRRKR